MSKLVIYGVLSLLIILAGGYLLLGESSQDNSGIVATGSGTEGDFQEVVLGIRNLNYYPNTVTVNAGEKVRIYLDETVIGCYRSFTIRQFGISKYLKTPNDYLEFTPTKPGTYGFSCSMGMGTGTLIVRE